MRDDRRVRRLEFILSLLGVLVIFALIFAVPQLRHGVSLAFHGDLRGMRHQLRDLGAWGVMVVVALILGHAVLFFPSEIVNATAGFVYGFVPGFALVMTAWLVSGLIAYVLGRTVAQPLIIAIFGRARFAGLCHWVDNGGLPLLLAGRLLPFVPSAPFSYLLGAAGVPVLRFAWTTVAGSLPLTAAVTLLGSRAQSLSLSDPAVWIAVGLFLALLAAARWLRFEVPER